MSESGKSTGGKNSPGSRILRERAMKILRETRAGIDPALLAAMKERFSGMVPPDMRPAPAPEAPQIFKSFDEKPPEPESTTEPVDKQKIAQIILQYMKNREEKSKH